jgi:Ni,Fe-hydrogenase III small subunit
MLANLAKKMFPRSLWVYHCNSGACNGCDIEILNVLTPFYDIERFGMKLVTSPRHGDVMLISGAVTRPTLPLVKRAYEAMPKPKLVFGIGSCTIGGNMWFD